MSSINELAIAKQYVISTLFDNFAVKFLTGAVTAIALELYDRNVALVNFMVVAYVVDFVLGFAVAAKYRRVSSWRFVKGATKLAVYWVLVFIGMGMDEVCGTGQTFVSLMFASIFLRDSASIIENLHILGYDVPYFLVKYLAVAQHGIEKKFRDALGVPQDGEAATSKEDLKK